ncbi:MAG: L-seryl-tRNA(Sec) selenium transferase [Candidatus Adiutrix sp.]|jgi:L-seryl-tRNA(Ser) seleniumtransferase|nr:L-seryl-tRNA(Sec) selenium transferase [Candidatus Adiutrix sp.]
MKPDLLRTIPKVDLLLEKAGARPDMAAAPYIHLLAAIRRTLADLRRDLRAGRAEAAPDLEALLRTVSLNLKEELTFSLRPVVNATGIVLHTNLGRSVLSEAAAGWVAQIASSYTTLEYDPLAGGRGSRQAHLETLLTRLTGAEAALAVNNNAAALLLIMAALCGGREIVVSRGELVEIGGSFRLPEILKQGGVRLREVGTTNQTTPADYAEALDPERVGGLLKVHPSNFRIIGYTRQPETAELAALAAARGLPLIYDLGSGLISGLEDLKISGEPTVAQVLAEGADLVCFSGDKLLGGAQAGLIVGRKNLVARLKTHPLARPLRIDKLTLAALEATLRLHLDPERARREIPTLAMIFAEPAELHARAERLKDLLTAADPTLVLEVVAVEGQTGGGAAPERPLPSWAVAVVHPRLSAERLEAALRGRDMPIVARIGHDRLLLDVRTIRPGQLPLVAEALADRNLAAG